MYVFTNNTGFDSLQLANYNFLQSKTFKDYQISLLSLPFLNPKTRENVLNDLYLVQIVKD
jgi:hypothetical protein